MRKLLRALTWMIENDKMSVEVARMIVIYRANAIKERHRQAVRESKLKVKAAVA